MISRRSFAVLLALAPLPLAAEPMSAAEDAVRRFYADLNRPYDTRAFSKVLEALYQAARRNSRRLGGPVEGLGFDPRISGQDFTTDFTRTLAFSVVSQNATRAEVRATFNNRGPRELRYDMVREDGRWRINDIRGVGGNDPWVFSDMLRRGAAER